MCGECTCCIACSLIWIAVVTNTRHNTVVYGQVCCMLCVACATAHVMGGSLRGAPRPRQRSGPVLLCTAFSLFLFFPPCINVNWSTEVTATVTQRLAYLQCQCYTQCQCFSILCSFQCNQGQNNTWDSNKRIANTLWFAGCIEVQSGFERCSIPCLPGLFALDVCASIHLYASNASAPLHSVPFGTIDV